ncbi:restriction endonuclease subunit S [Rubritalea profundi]|nr:restriction endonuclease subunit S [Rubritalea profundi]
MTIPLRNKINNNRKQIRSLTKHRDTLLPKLISGELRLPEAEHLTTEALS